MTDDFINREWRTNLKLKVKDGMISFRGFKGEYRISWKNADGASRCKMLDCCK